MEKGFFVFCFLVLIASMLVTMRFGTAAGLGFVLVITILSVVLSG